jgi:hypothetical protein
VGARLEWVRLAAAEHCLDADAARERVTSRLRYDPFQLPPTRRIDVVVERTSSGWSSQLVARDAQGAVVGSRSFESANSDCTSIGDATVLAVVLAIDARALLGPEPAALPAPSSASAPSPSPPPDTASPAPSSPPPPSHSPVTQTPASPPIGPTPTLGPRLALLAGSLPRLAPGVEIAFSAPLPWFFALHVAVDAFPAQATSDTTYAFGLTVGWARLCARHAFETLLGVHACASLAAGVLHAYGNSSGSVQIEGAGDYPWFAAGIGGGASARLVGRLTVEAEITGIAPFSREHFLVRGRTAPAFVADPVGVLASLGLALRF